MNSDSPTGVVASLFTDIEGSTRLWEQEPARMESALACHDAIARAAVEGNRGAVVKTTGDGVYAAFEDPLDAIGAAVQLQHALADPARTNDIALRVRCGLHVGAVERRGNDFFGSSVNRAARIMGAAHGGQVLLSQAVLELVRNRLPTMTSVRDLGIVRLRDLISPEHLFQVIHPQLAQEFPALRSLDETPNNLPQQLTPFICRDREMAELKQLLETSRLLTLVGGGGLGKTRLSLQVAADLLDNFPDGVWFVDLAPLTDAQRVPDIAAFVLGVKIEPGRSVLQSLVEFVRDRRLLLVLDNCEHLVHACAELARQLLQWGPSVKVLATSRENLHIAGETVYSVPSLAVPKPRETIAPTALTQYDAVRFFIDRAVAAQPGFQITNRNAHAVADICYRLEGIPLALELAAARVRGLPIEKIAERLRDRFRLLKGGDQTASPRQQTLRASLAWSYDLLTRAERAVLRRLAVFVDGWTLEAAEAVGAGGEVDAADVIDLLSNLVEKSLVLLDGQSGRYKLLETVREFASEQLRESGEYDDTRDRHLAFYLALAEQVEPMLFGPEPPSADSRLDADWENIEAAVNLRTADLATAQWSAMLTKWPPSEQVWRLLYLRRAYQPFSSRRHADDLRDLVRDLPKILESVNQNLDARRQSSEVRRCDAFRFTGEWALSHGCYEAAAAYLEKCVAIARVNGNRQDLAGVIQELGLSYLNLGDTTKALKSLEEALLLREELGDELKMYQVLADLAYCHRKAGDLHSAMTRRESALAAARGTGDVFDLVKGLANLAIVSVDRGLVDRARPLLLEALAIVEDVCAKPAGVPMRAHANPDSVTALSEVLLFANNSSYWSKTVWGGVLMISASLAASLEEWQAAARFYGAAEAAAKGYYKSISTTIDEAYLTFLLVKTRAALGMAEFAAAEAAGRALALEAAIAEARVWLEHRAD